jgi:CRISP-associated protein Cas1
MSLLFGGPRLGLSRVRLPYSERYALVYVSNSQLVVRDGCVHILTAGFDDVPAGDYALPQQTVSMLLLGPGCSVTHDVLRILARQGASLVAVGDGGIRSYSAPPWGGERSEVARAHARLWADSESRLKVARRMYAIRFGQVFPHHDLDVLRGIEGGRVRAMYQQVADRVGIHWSGRKYDRGRPESADLPNQAINHVVTCIESAAEIATYAVGAVPALGFIHETSANAFVLDITDLYRAELTVPLAFKAVKEVEEQGRRSSLEQVCRLRTAQALKRTKAIHQMIERIRVLLELERDAAPC